MNISYISRLYELFDEFAETEYVLGIMGIPNKLLYICPQTGKGTSFSNGIPAPI